jgi:hypothetical protein
MPPDSIERRIAASAARDSRFGSIASHTQACVSSRINSVCLPGFGLDDRGLDVAHDLHDPLQAANYVALDMLHRYHLRHRDTFLGDQHRLPALVDLVHDVRQWVLNSPAAMLLMVICR